MKRNLLLTTVLFAAGSLLAADPKDDVTTAAKTLADGGNYSWKQSIANADGSTGFGTGDTDGKTQKDGLIYISRTVNDNTIESVMKGTNGAVNGQDGWQTFEEMAQANGGGGGGGGGRRGGGFRNAPTLPAAQVQTLISSVSELKQSGGAYVGDFTEAGAKTVLMPPNFGRGGRGGGGGGGGGGNFTPPDVSGAKGSVRIWLKDGQLSKYEVKISGTISFNGNDRDIDRTTTVEIKDVGTTKINVPADVLKKIGG